MSEFEQWVLDGTLALNDATLTLEAITDTPAAKRPEWVSGADSDGEILGRPPKAANKVIEMRLRVAKQATMDLAISKIALVLDKLQECEQNANGLALVWTPADGTKSITWRALLGEITDLPKDWQDSGWFVRSPAFTVRLTCLPYGEGTEVLAGTVTSSDPIQTVELSGVGGDVPALARLVVTDAASQSRRWVCWGLESRHYPTSSPPSLIIDSSAMVIGTGYAGTTGTRTGAYSGATNNVITSTLRTQPQAICGLGNRSHVGDFRPQLRFYASATTMAVRLVWQALDGPFRSLSWKIPVVAGWNHVDLGLVSVPQTSSGAQRWTGRIEAYSTATGGETFQADVVCMVPAELFGRARASFAYAPGALTGGDDFTGTTAGAALNARVAPVGGTWATSGAATDYAFTDTGGERITRSTVSEAGPRYAILGSTNYTDQEVGVTFQATGGVPEPWVLARYVNSTNFLAADLRYGNPAWRVFAYVGGVTNVLGEIPLTLTYEAYKLRLIVFSSGQLVATLMDVRGSTLSEIRAFHSSLATAGALASGKPGIADYNGNSAASSRYYDDFYAATPAPEPIALHASQSIEFRSDTTLREDSTGTYAGPPPQYVGGRCFVPPAGGPGRKTRIAVMAKRNDVESMPDDNIADSTTVDVLVTPRYIAVPR